MIVDKCSHTSAFTISKWYFRVLLYNKHVWNSSAFFCVLLYLLQTRLINFFLTPPVHAIFSSRNFKRVIAMIARRGCQSKREKKKSHLPLEEIILPAQSFVTFYSPPQKLYCNGSNHAGVFLYLYLYLLHRWQEEGSPCSSSSHARGICRPWSCRSRQENRPGLARARGKRQEARKHRRSKVQSGPMQESVSPPIYTRNSSKQAKNDIEKNRQRTYCKSAVRGALQCDFGKQVEILISIPTSLTSFQLQYYIRGWGYLGIPETYQQAQLGVCWSLISFRREEAKQQVGPKWKKRVGCCPLPVTVVCLVELHCQSQAFGHWLIVL